jgi:hypothetical protein
LVAGCKALTSFRKKLSGGSWQSGLRLSPSTWAGRMSQAQGAPDGEVFQHGRVLSARKALRDPPERRLAQVRSLIDRETFFVIHTPPPDREDDTDPDAFQEADCGRQIRGSSAVEHAASAFMIPFESAFVFAFTLSFVCVPESPHAHKTTAQSSVKSTSPRRTQLRRRKKRPSGRHRNFFQTRHTVD